MSAEVVFHGSGTQLNGAMSIDAAAGELRVDASNNANLFHSFSVFNVLPGESATFQAPGGGVDVQNVISRVTGGVSAITNSQQSFIFGGISSLSMPNADFYLINPNGIVLGNTASINVGGSFYATTAESLELADGGVFFADPGATSVLTTAPPSAFGFGENPAGIDVPGQGFFAPPVAQFNVAADGKVALVGGDIRIRSVALLGDAGGAGALNRLELTSVGSEGSVPVNNPGALRQFEQLGKVSVEGGSLVDAKEIVVRGGRLVVDNSSLSPGSFGLLPIGPSPNGGMVDVLVRDSATFSGATPIGSVQPGIFVFNNFPGGVVPSVTVVAGEVNARGIGGIRSQRLGPGPAGQVTVVADKVSLRNGGSIISSNFSGGDPGANVRIVADEVSISRDGAANFTGVAVQGDDVFNPAFGSASGVTHAGSLTMNVGRLEIRNGGEISNDSFALGRSGGISIVADEIIADRNGAAVGGITSQSGVAGNAGTINIHAGTIDLSGGFKITAAIAGVGDAGGVNVRATERITMSGADTGIFATAFNSGPLDLDRYAQSIGAPNFAALPFDIVTFLGFFGIDPGPGNGGTIRVESPLLEMRGGSRIDSSTFGDGNAGNVNAFVKNIVMEDAAQIRSQSGGIAAGSGAVVAGVGNGGRVFLNAEDISITGRQNGASAGLTTRTLGDGNGGQVLINTARLFLGDGAEIRADSSGLGVAGNIRIDARDHVRIHNASINTESALAGGGQIVFRIVQLLDMFNASISTSVASGFGGGGDVDIDPAFIVLQNSNITANAFAGPGGNITLVAGQFLTDQSSVIEAKSALSIDGTIEVDAPDSDVESDVVVLQDAFLDAASLMRGGCEASHAGGGTNRLGVSGKGGVGADPGEFLASNTMAADEDATAFADESSGTMLAVAWNPPTCRW